MSVSECYFPAGSEHQWQAAIWRQLTAEDFQCSDPFRRMVITWDGKHTMPCCQGFTLEIDGGPVVANGQSPGMSIKEIWASPNFNRLRSSHRQRTWDRPTSGGEPICRACAVTKVPLPSEEETDPK
jgi:hypothetical protein